LNRSWAFKSSMGTAAVLLPLIAAVLLPHMASADSHIQTEAGGGVFTATAHVNFKIVIPKVLYLNVGADRQAAVAQPPGTQTVAIMSNNRNVMLNGTVRALDDDASRAAGHGRAGVILSASAGKIIAQDALCTAGAIDHRQVVCTVSMP
jgi:hypothetical protein